MQGTKPMNWHSTVYPGSSIKAENRPRYHARPNLSEADFSEANLLEDGSMLDILMVALALGFFALSVGYAYACDRL